MFRDIFFAYWYDFIFGIIIAGLTFGFRWMVKVIKQLRGENVAQKAGMRAMLRDRIVQAYAYFYVQKQWTLQSRDSVFELYEQYKALGGNGSVTHLMDFLRTLPIETGKEDSA